MKVITSGCELEEYIFNEYDKHDDELSSLFFDVEVSMKQRDILEAYQSIQYAINGDYVVRMENGEEQEEFLPGGMYEEKYTGNCREFLESFNGKDIFRRYMTKPEALLSFIW